MHRSCSSTTGRQSNESLSGGCSVYMYIQFSRRRKVMTEHESSLNLPHYLTLVLNLNGLAK